MITPADHALAAELGLVLEPALPDPRDAELGRDPRARRVPERWSVKLAATSQLAGWLRFTAADCLYATKLAVGVTGREDTTEAALRWIAPKHRHVRTGASNGTEVATTPSGKTFERPIAVTACGAAPSGGDYTRVAAKADVTDGCAQDMCPACLAWVEAQGVKNLAHLTARRGTSSPKQRDYLRRLAQEGARNGRPYLVDNHTLDTLSLREASSQINQLVALKQRGWKGDLL